MYMVWTCELMYMFVDMVCLVLLSFEILKVVRLKAASTDIYGLILMMIYHDCITWMISFERD